MSMRGWLSNLHMCRFEEHMTMFNIATQTVLGTKVKDRGEEHPLSSLRRSAEALHSAGVLASSYPGC